MTTSQYNPDRRICLDKFTAAERAIYDATSAVERAGCDTILTDAVNLLSQARSKVSDWVDQKPERQIPATEPEESGWLIERYINGSCRWWNGRGTGDECFVGDSNEAIRFMREQDGAVVLSWMLNGHGRVTEHAWVPNPHYKNPSPTKI